MSVYCIQESGGMIIWLFKKQSVVVLFLTEVEYAVTVSVVQEIMYFRVLLKSFGYEQMESIFFYCDN